MPFYDRNPFRLEEGIKKEGHILKEDSLRKLCLDIIQKLPSEYLLGGAYRNVKEKIPAFMGIEYAVFKLTGEIVQIKPAVLAELTIMIFDYLEYGYIGFF